MAFKSYVKENKAEKNYEVIQKFGKISDGKKPKELRLVSWNGRNPKYDIREWFEDENGEEKCSKGLTLTGEELTNLFELLKDMDEESEEE